MPSRWKPNVTVAAIIERVVDGRQEFLLVEEETTEGLRLNNPGRPPRPGETPQHGAEREALEETARRFTPDSLVGIYLSRVRRPANGDDVTYLRVAFGGQRGRARTGPSARRRHRPHAVDEPRRGARQPRTPSQPAGPALHRGPRRPAAASRSTRSTAIRASLRADADEEADT